MTPASSSAQKKLRLVRSYLGGRPVWCSWQVTRRCGALCFFCDHRREAASDVDLVACARIVAELTRLGSLVVSLTGGDPFLRNDLPEIVSLLARDHIPIATTHGFALRRESAREAWRAGLEGASVLLEDAVPERHDAAVGLSGAYDRAVVALRALSEERTREGQRVNVKVRLGSGSVEGLEVLLALARGIGATVTVEPSFPVGAGLDGSGLQRDLLGLKARVPELRTGTYFLLRIEEALGTGVPGCQAARTFFNVDHRGRVSKCVEFQGPEDRVGDLASEGISDVLPRLKAVHARNTCRACWHGSRGEVEGLYTLRGLAQALPALVRA
jgi:MoaA/NifB/PqqE/SkfB family radical SAM enzyme